MANGRDATRTPTKRPGSSSNANTPRSKPNGSQRHVTEDDLPLPPQDIGSIESTNLDAYFAPLPPSRAASIYSVNRATLSGQLSQLTSTDLPDADSLSAKITAIPTASAAAKALTNSAKQIKSWIRTAVEVLGGLDAQDDVEWAGAGSKDGVADVDVAIKKFEKLVLTYIASVEEAQKRPDIKSVPKQEMTTFLDTLEEVIVAWEKVKQSLQRVKTQNELAMEWEDLWNITLGEIGQEIEELSTLVFELEEKRHMGVFDEVNIDHASGMDMKELETIVEETSALGASGGSRATSMQPASPLMSPGLNGPSDDSGLLSLFARMQPLRASLDFLPMQLTTYENKSKKIFPSACGELQARRQTLEARYKTLETDAETLRKELGEDKWNVVFRNAARQAQTMCESIEKSIQKLRETLKDEAKANNANYLAKKISEYEGKRNNYGPAIRKVLAVIDKGVKERATLNGEILRLHEDIRHQWTEVEKKLKDTDAFLEEAQASRSQQLRDSISTIMSTDMSGTASGVGTPDSSIASSPAVGPADHKLNMPATPDVSLARSRNSSARSLSSSRPSVSRRVVSQPVTASISSRRQSTLPSPMSRLSSASPSPAPRPNGVTPMSTIHSSRTVTPGTATASKPRWSVGSAVDRKLLEAKPKFTPSAYARRLKESKPSVYSFRSTSGSAVSSALPSPSPLGVPSSTSSMRSTSHTIARAASSLGIRSRRDSSPTPSFGGGSTTGSVIDEANGGRPRSRLYRPSLGAVGTSTPSAIRIPSIGSRNGGSSRRTSMLPLPASNMSPSLPTFNVDGHGSFNGSLDGFEDDDILPSIEQNDIASPTPAAAKRRLPVRPASSLAHSGGGSYGGGPYIAHTRASLLRAGSAAPTAGPQKEKPRWR